MVSRVFLTFYHSDTDSPASLFPFPFKDTCNYIESVSHSVVSDSVTSWTVAHQAPLSMGFCRVIPFSRGSSPPRDRTQISHIVGMFFSVWATKEAWLLHWAGIISSSVIQAGFLILR